MFLKAKTLFDGNRYEQALSICERASQKIHSSSGRDQLTYLQGRCLFALGRSGQALAVWKQLEGGDYAWQAGVQRCKLYFHNNQFAEAFDELGTLWERADGLQHNDVIQIWVEQMNAMLLTRRPQLLRTYLDFRIQLVFCIHH